MFFDRVRHFLERKPLPTFRLTENCDTLAETNNEEILDASYVLRYRVSRAEKVYQKVSYCTLFK